MAVSAEGILEISAKAIIYFTGCRERPLELPKNILSHRCSGIITSLSTLKLINRMGIMPGKEVLVLRLEPLLICGKILEGANVKRNNPKLQMVLECSDRG